MSSRFVLTYSAPLFAKAHGIMPRDGALILSEVVSWSSPSSVNRAGGASGTTWRASSGNPVGTPSSPICSRRW